MSTDPRSPAPEQRKTELVDPRYAMIDSLSTAEALVLQAKAQMEAAEAVLKAVPFIAPAVEAATKALRHSEGRLIYVGAGTSGRLGILDRSELLPTFGWPTARLAYMIAGGQKAMFEPVEGAEDDKVAGRDEMTALAPTRDDVVIGIAASGTTPYTIAAIREARAAGAVTIGIANNASGPLLEAAEFPVPVETGSEPIAGSTRLKAGTAQKITLNSISSQIMINLHKVHKGMMVDMLPTNDKLKERAVRMVEQATLCERHRAVSALQATENKIKPAILVATFNVSAEAARETLRQHDGSLHASIEALALKPVTP